MFRLFQSSTRQIKIYPAATNNVGRSTVNSFSSIPSTSTRWLSSTSTSTSTSSATSNTNNNILKIAIVGSGPSGCYTTKYLQSALEKQQQSATISIIERLPIPYGLVRHGVAPDHPEVKNVQNDFAKLFVKDVNAKDDNSKPQSTTSIQLYANVQVGNDVSLQELRQVHDVVVLCYGCESDRKLGIPHEESLQGVLSAREFVAWYNGHVDYLHIGQQVKDALSSSSGSGNDATTTNIVVIGQGNVALDCARILAKPKELLLATDLASHALDILDYQPQQQPRTIHVVGRRGHVQGAFTIKVGYLHKDTNVHMSTKHV
jgi:adrenodoxin-NADP+ reductase